MPDIIAGKYEVLETIGRGGMGTVYKARQTNLDRVVAIKMLSEELASDPEFRARFQQEATVVARLNHPNIVQVHDIEPHKNTFCIIMEFVDGENLQHKIDRDVTLPEVEAMGIGAQVARALAYAHTRGIIHRDIKPDNIHVTPKGVAKVMDFGIARFLDSKLKTQTGISMGTPKFMSPEQVTGKNVDGQTDLYSLGICLYYCLAGRPPFDGENAISVATRHLYEQPEPPAKINPSISLAVEKAILKALEKQKTNRYKTGTEMAEALEAAVGMKNDSRDTVLAGSELSGATVKMPAQGYVPATGDVLESVGQTNAGVENSGSQAVHDPENARAMTSPAGMPVQSPAMTPHNVPELDASFRTPNAAHESKDPTRDFRKALVVFGGLIVAAIILLVALVLWLRSGDGSIVGPGSVGMGGVTATERLERVESQAQDLLAAGRAKDARRLWLEFRKEHPRVMPERVSNEIHQVEELLPLSESADLAERRYQEAFDALKKEVQERALAFAYLKSAVALSPGLARSAITTNTLQNLERKLATAPGAAAVESAAQARRTAQERMQSGDYGSETYRMLVQAVETDYSSAENWEALGDYLVETRNIDSARVMYAEASTHTQDASKRNSLQEKLAKISR